MICPKCESVAPDGVKFCPSCGANLLSDVASAAVENVVSEVKNEVSEPVSEQIENATESMVVETDSLPNASFDPGAPIAIPKQKEELNSVGETVAEAVPEVAPVVETPAFAPASEAPAFTPAPQPVVAPEPQPAVQTAPFGVAPIPMPSAPAAPAAPAAPLTPNTFAPQPYTPVAPIEEPKKAKKEKYSPDMPKEYKPLSVGGAFWLLFLFAIPVVGFIFAIVFSISGKKESRKNLSRAVLIWQIIAIIVILAIVILLYFLVKPAFEALMEGDYNGFIDELYDMIGL